MVVQQLLLLRQCIFQSLGLPAHAVEFRGEDHAPWETLDRLVGIPNGIELGVFLLVLVIGGHHPEEALVVADPLLLPVGQVLRVLLAQHVINDRTYQEGRLDYLNLLLLDEFVESTEDNPRTGSCSSERNVVLVDAELD